MNGPLVKTLECTVSMDRFINEFIDIPRFEKACSECPGYSKTWACPPYSFSRLDVWQNYTAVRLVGKKVSVPQELRAEPIPTDQIRSVWDSILSPVKQELTAELLELESQTPGSLALFAGGCDFCTSCTRQEGLPCRAPEKMRCSLESLGADVTKCITRLLNDSLLWAENGYLPEYYILLGGLLIK